MATATAERKRLKNKVRLNFEAFRDAVKTASHAVSRRTANFAHSSVCIGHGLVSGQTVGEYRVDVDLLEAQCDPMLLPQDRLHKILHSATPGDVTLTQDGDACIVKIGRSEWRLPTADAAEFAAWEPTGLHNMPSLPGDEFSRAVKHVIYAVEKHGARACIGGVLIEAVGSQIDFVATNGHRISRATCTHDSATDDFVTKPKELQKSAPVVPVQPLSQLLQQCKPGLLVSMRCNQGTFVANVGSVTVTAATLQGTFPSWRNLFPEELPLGNSVVRQSLLTAVQSASIVTSESSRGVTFAFRNNAVTLTAKSSECGEATIECGIDDHQADATVKLNPGYVTEFLRPFGADADPCVTIRVCPKDGRTWLSCGDEYRGVIMPLAEDA